MHTRTVLSGWRAANALSGMRLVLIPIIWLAAMLGNGRLVGLGLIVAGATDFLDGYLARRLHQESRRGARLDSLADNLLLISAAFWIELLHPQILRENVFVVAATLGVYLSSLAVGLLKFQHLGNLHLYSSKVAGGLLYSFAVITLLTGIYSPVLLWLAAAAFMISSAETFFAQLLLSAVDENMGSLLPALRRRAETRTIQPIGSARKQRSQTPHAANDVANSARPARSIATSATPNANEIRP
jgi:cardiolipin synthase (CMP-forming)